MDVIFKEFHTIINKINNDIGWTEGKLLKKSGTYPISKSPDVGSKGCADYEELCFPESVSNENTVKITDHQLQMIVDNPWAKAPNKFSDLQLNFNREQKLSIYEFVASKCKKSNEEKVLDETEWNKFTKFLKNHKATRRKKRKHRKTKITYKEEIRALIELHMKALSSFKDGTVCKPNRKRNKRKASNDKTVESCISKSKSPLPTTSSSSKPQYTNKLERTTHEQSSGGNSSKLKLKQQPPARKNSERFSPKKHSPPRRQDIQKSKRDRSRDRSRGREFNRRTWEASPPPYRSQHNRKENSFRRSRSKSRSLDRYNYYQESYMSKGLYSRR